MAHIDIYRTCYCWAQAKSWMDCILSWFIWPAGEPDSTFFAKLNIFVGHAHSSIISSGFPKFWTPDPPPASSRSLKALTPPLNWWCNTWMSVTGKNVQFCKESTIRFASWPDESAKNTTIYSQFRTWSELSNNRLYKFQFVLMYNLTFIRKIIVDNPALL